MSAKRKYRVALIEPSEIIALGLQRMFDGSRDFVLTTVVSDLTQFCKAEDCACDLLILNTSVAGFQARLDIRACLPIGFEVPLVGLLVGLYDDTILAQYDACIGIYDTAERIEQKLHTAITQTDASPKVDNGELSVRERSILAAVAQGKTNKEIADEFHLSIYTIATHRKNISHKLGINSIAGLTVYAMMNRLIDTK